MAGNGLVDSIPCAFRGVDHMLTGKNFTYNVRALRLLVETVIQNTVQKNTGTHRQTETQRQGNRDLMSTVVGLRLTS